MVESAISSNVGLGGAGGAWAGVMVASLFAMDLIKKRSRALSTRGGDGGRAGGGWGGGDGGLLRTTGTTMQDPRWGRRRTRRRIGGSCRIF